MPRRNSPDIDDEQEVIPRISPICTYCNRLQGFRVCDAFEEIPVEIWTGANNHKRSFDRDGGLLFEQWKPKSVRMRGKIL